MKHPVRVISRLSLLAIIAASWAAAGLAADLPPAIEAARMQEFADCRGAGGQPSTNASYATSTDFNGDGQADYLINLAGLDCVSAWSFFCGSAGCPVSIWLSGREGYSVVWSSHAQEAAIRGNKVAVALHGSFCTPPRAGVDGCEVLVDPVAEASRTAVTSAPSAPPAPPTAASGWRLSEPANSPAVAMVDGPGIFRTIAAFCLQGQGWLAFTFRTAPAGDEVRVDFGFPGGAQWGPAVRGPGTGEAYVVGLTGHGLARALAGRDSTVPLSLDGAPQGLLSLSGSSRALRSALAPCLRL